MKKGVNERFIKRLQEFNDSLFLGMEKKGVVFTKKNGKWMLTKEI